MAISRTCRCGCGRSFYVPATMPGREYIHGHKPRQPELLKPGNVLRAKFGGRTDGERRSLDYQLALKTAQAETAALVEAIDAIDDRLEVLRRTVQETEEEKYRLTDRHLAVSASVEILQVLIEGKSVREITAEPQRLAEVTQ